MFLMLVMIVILNSQHPHHNSQLYVTSVSGAGICGTQTYTRKQTPTTLCPPASAAAFTVLLAFSRPFIFPLKYFKISPETLWISKQFGIFVCIYITDVCSPSFVILEHAFCDLYRLGIWRCAYCPNVFHCDECSLQVWKECAFCHCWLNLEKSIRSHWRMVLSIQPCPHDFLPAESVSHW